MCGIFGFIGYRNIDVGGATNIISHRGPDAEGYLLAGDSGIVSVSKKPLHQAENQFRICFGFRRLAVIDLHEEANQPMFLPEHQCAIVYNGEIYNYQELREELQILGCRFRTTSDTEVLLQAYIQWGEDCVQRFNGMWAFAILDHRRNKLFCSRDRFGVKPFFYYLNPEKSEFIFGSEIKQLIKAGVPKALNENLVKDFLVNSISDHTQQTFFQGIFNLLPGNSLSIDLQTAMSGKVEIVIAPYWKLQPKPEYERISYQEACATFRELFESSIRFRLRSDVPLGSCLSGGLDSSSIVCTTAHLSDFTVNAFTSTFSEKAFDESGYVSEINRLYPHVKNYYCSLTEEIFLRDLDKVLWHQDEPFATLGILAQWEVMKLARASNVTVLLDGQGGDETLGGYRKYYAFFLKELFRKGQIAKAVLEGSRLVFNSDFNFFQKEGIKRYLGMTASLPFLTDKGKMLPYTGNIHWRNSNTFREKSLEDIEKYSFPPLLRFEDRNSMAHSIETRVPFMDYRLVQFLHSIPTNYLIRKGYTKAILRDALRPILPDAIRLRKSKLGFATPQSVWMEKKLNGHFSQYFKTMNNLYLDAKVINKDFLKYPKSSLHSWDFSRFYIFDRWLKMNFN